MDDLVRDRIAAQGNPAPGVDRLMFFGNRVGDPVADMVGPDAMAENVKPGFEADHEK